MAFGGFGGSKNFPFVEAFYETVLIGAYLDFNLNADSTSSLP
jgi:hypothetical protein